MDLGIRHKTSLVLGAAGGLGSAIASELASEGSRVILVDRDASGLDQISKEFRRIGYEHDTALLDLGDLKSFDHVLGAIPAIHDVDILINITGGPPPGPIADQDSSVWRAHFETMVLSVIKVTDFVLPGMRERRWGRIITSTSSGVVAPIPNLGLSNSLRLSLVGWSKTLAREIAPFGITSNIVIPGRIETARVRQLDSAAAKREGRPIVEVVASSYSNIPVGRYGEASEYSFAVAMLASERASYITGTTVRVDGGLLSNI